MAEPKKVTVSIMLVAKGDTSDDIACETIWSNPFSCSNTISSAIATKTNKTARNKTSARINLEVIHVAFLVVAEEVTLYKNLIFIPKIMTF